MSHLGLNKRPVNLALWTIRFPIPAIISILHRLSGFLLFLLIPFTIYVWQYSLISADNFDNVKTNFQSLSVKFLVWLFISALIYHLIAGIRHLLMDMHIGDSKVAGRVSSYIVLALSIILALGLGVYIW